MCIMLAMLGQRDRSWCLWVATGYVRICGSWTVVHLACTRITAVQKRVRGAKRQFTRDIQGESYSISMQI